MTFDWEMQRGEKWVRTEEVVGIAPKALTDSERGELLRLRVANGQLIDLICGWQHRAERAEGDLCDARDYLSKVVVQQNAETEDRRNVERALLQARETIRIENKSRQAAEDQAFELAKEVRRLQAKLDRGEHENG